jgi:2-amino-4-hydroxy-6-hydroxymethyldihydropteridine diphosphokinase
VLHSRAETTMARALISLGSNLGDRAANLAAALAALGRHPSIVVLNASRFHSWPAIGGPLNQAGFLNAAACLETSLAPEELLIALQQVEQDLGRQRTTRWAARTIDVDLLLYDELVMDLPDLLIPHPRMAFRRFVLVPAAEVAADMRHSITGWTIAQHLRYLETALPYVAVTGLPGVGHAAVAESVAQRTGARLLRDPATTDSTGHVQPAELELLDRRAGLLRRDAWPSNAATAISDFWIEQSCVLAAPHLDESDLRSLELRLASLAVELVPPKLLVVLQDCTLDRSEDTERAKAQRELLCRARRPGVGPLLVLPAGDPAGAVDEVEAAIAAMREPCRDPS